MLKKLNFVHFLGFWTVITLLYCFVLTPLLSYSGLTHLEIIKQQGFIRFVSYNSASTLTQNESGSDGLEYQLAQGFAEYIGVAAQFKTVQNFNEVFSHIVFKDADIAAAGLTEFNTDSGLIQFGPRYYQVTPQIIYKKGTTRYKNLKTFNNTLLEVTANSGNQSILSDLKIKQQKLNWHILDDIASEEAIEMVNDGFIQYLIVDSHNFALQRRFYPELRIAFELKQKKSLKWMLKASPDDSSLLDRVHDYFQTIKTNGQLEQWTHRYLSNVEKFNYSDLKTFNGLLKKRLPKYRKLFEKEAKANALDWRLLAAMGYQESFWNPRAKSPTGVRGLMMLTKVTAKQMGIDNRLDAAKSIKGGAKYLKVVIKKIPKRINKHDRVWMALASYNVGYGHLEDARKITVIRGGDPDKWLDVKKSLPLLSRKKWYKKTKYGYARGAEPVKYVENIRKYYDLLVWHSNKGKDKNNTHLKPSNKEAVNSINLSPSF